MRLKKLTIKNINSIFGTWEVNFEDDAFASNSIFAIVGKNGSGKSTILDAISLALYDQTARLGERGRAAFPSHGTKESMSTLVFELDGKEYTSQMTLKADKAGNFKSGLDKTATWIQWVDDKGQLQKAEGTQDKCAKVKELLGLNFNQFCQVILLAQGKFNAFLTAKPNERADILEQITNTTIYSAIGKKVNEKKKDINRDFENKAAELAGIRETLLSVELLQEKNERLQAIQTEEGNLNGEIKALEGFLGAAKSLQECEASLNTKAVEEEALKKEETTFETTEHPRLIAGKKAALVTPPYVAFTQLDSEQQRENARLQELTSTEIPAKAHVEETSLAEQKAREDASQKAKNDQTLRVAILDAADELDKEIASLSKQFTEGKSKLDGLRKEYSDLVTAVKKCEKELADLNNSKAAADTYLQNHAQDNDLEAKCAIWENQYDSLNKQKSEIEKKGKALSKQEKAKTSVLAEKEEAAKKLQGAELQRDTAKADLGKAQNAWDAAAAGRELKEFRSDCEDQQKVVALLTALKPQELLTTFQEGEPCPVCGATHHPYRGLPKEDFPDLENAKKKLEDYQNKFSAASDAFDKLGDAEKSLKDAEKKFNDAQEKLNNCTTSCTAAQQTFEETKADLDATQKSYDQDVAKLQAELTSKGFSWDGKSELPDEIRKRRDEYKKQSKLQAEFQAQEQSIQMKQSGEEGKLKGKKEEVNRKIEDLEALLDQSDEKSEERQTKYADVTDSKAERAALEGAITKAQQEKNRAAGAHTTALTELNLAKAEAEKLTASVAKRAAELEAKRKVLEEALQMNGLDLNTYRNSVLEPATLANLSSKETNLQVRRSELNKAVAALQTAQAEAQAKLPEDFDKEQAEQKKGQKEEERRALLEERGGIATALETHHKNEAAVGEKKKALDDLERTKIRWEKLDKWIGNENFRKHAQRYTFEILMAKANEQIKSMLNGRYSLCTNPASDDLSIQVIDELLGGDMRSSANLSGGEQFAVSMALALGLSEMVGQKFHVDSLFLDEGFGSLDGDELEHAMGVLKGLTNRGKLVGVISHIEDLKSSIGTQIHLKKLGNGSSSLEGPGVTKMANPELFVSKAEKEAAKAAEKAAKAAAKAAKKAAKAAEKAAKKAAKANQN